MESPRFIIPGIEAGARFITSPGGVLSPRGGAFYHPPGGVLSPPGGAFYHPQEGRFIIQESGYGKVMKSISY
jgi:hypothetical protein